jgi:hypothetical protein
VRADTVFDSAPVDGSDNTDVQAGTPGCVDTVMVIPCPILWAVGAYFGVRSPVKSGQGTPVRLAPSVREVR